ncbi:MAG: glycosyltransferase [Saprospiraceae bacterium]
MLFAYLAFSLATALAYAAIIACYLHGWRRLPGWEIPPGFAPKTAITVLVPARNEAANIGESLQALLACPYPAELLEILVLDDHSDDDTADIASQAAVASAGRVRVIRLAKQGALACLGKKNALALGVSCARGELIATTDADCLVPPDWLLLLASLYEAERPGAIVGPVEAHRERTGFQRFQALDLAGMAGITGAGIALGWHRIGNGANLCYAKSAFEAVGGYAGNSDRASGDDVFLLQKIARQCPVLFLKNPAAVRTEVCPDLPAFVQQRLRWGTKNTALPEPGAKAVLAVVFLCCTTLVLNTVLLFFVPTLAWAWLGQLALKALTDYVLLREMCRFFGRRDLLLWFWPAFCWHTAYIAGIGTGSLFVKKYVWKGRAVR